mgnify:CR=1 FL=1
MGVLGQFTHDSMQVTQSLRGYIQFFSGSADFMLLRALSHLPSLSWNHLQDGLQNSMSFGFGSTPFWIIERTDDGLPKSTWSVAVCISTDLSSPNCYSISNINYWVLKSHT